jgi:cytosine/uracil/thiamine/allantoin permease
VDRGICHLQVARLQWPGLADSAVIGAFSNEHIQVNVAQFVCFLIFWAINVGDFLARHGKHPGGGKLGRAAADRMGLALLIWAYIKADGFGPMLSQPDKFETSADFWKVFSRA